MEHKYDIKRSITFVLMLLLINLAINCKSSTLLHLYSNPNIHAHQLTENEVLALYILSITNCDLSIK